MEKEEDLLAKSSKNIKTAVIELSDKIKKQDLMIESINADTDKNNDFLSKNMIRFCKVISILDNDPRNKIILILILFLLFLVLCLIH